MNQNRYLTAKEATARLGVNASTLYAYVSRGLIRSEAVSESSRERRYLAEDVQLLVDRKAQRRDPTLAAQEALHWGTPILDSALTLITEQALYYRGQNTHALAQTHIFEEVAALLWSDDSATNISFSNSSISHLLGHLAAPTADHSPLSAMQIALTIAAEHDLGAYNLTPRGAAQTGSRILQLLTNVLTQNADAYLPVAAALAHRWHLDSRPEVVRLFDATLILCADHELNASSFTARVIASTDATPYAVVIGGLAALQGVKHGGLTRRAAEFLREVEATDNITGVIRTWVQRGDSLPGFGHPLYPQGDPRAKILLSLFEAININPDYLRLTNAVIHEIQQATGDAPTIDFALATVERALNLPPDSGLALFALGRTAGWIAHAIEQYSTRQLIRPRAKYVGKLP